MILLRLQHEPNMEPKSLKFLQFTVIHTTILSRFFVYNLGVDGGFYDLGNSNRCVFHIDHWLAILRRTTNGSCWKMLRAIHGRCGLQLYSPGIDLSVINYCRRAPVILLICHLYHCLMCLIRFVAGFFIGK